MRVCRLKKATGSEPGPNGLDNLYIPTGSLAICFSVLEDSGPSAETCLDTEQRTCPQPAAFFSRRTWYQAFSRFFLHGCEIKSGSGLGTRLRCAHTVRT